MRVVALLAWFDEDEGFLARAVRSAALAGCKAVVCLDGAYADYPGSGVTSGKRQTRAIQRAAREEAIACVIEQPTTRWPTEMAKRTALFALADRLTDVGDWLLVLDADYEVVPCDLPALLADVTGDVALVRLETPRGPNGHAKFGPAPVMAMRSLFRARLGLRVEGNHYTYLTADGRRLWGNETTAPLEPAADLTDDVTIRHWTYHRTKARIGAQFDYYRARDAAGLELGVCGVCKQRPGGVMVPCNIRQLDDDRLESKWLEVCSVCEPGAMDRARAEAEALGADPWHVTVRVPLTVEAA